MTGAIRYTCRTPNCDGTCSFDSDTFIPKDWLCPRCTDALQRQENEAIANYYADEQRQREVELARKLVALATEKERENNL